MKKDPIDALVARLTSLRRAQRTYLRIDRQASSTWGPETYTCNAICNELEALADDLKVKGEVYRRVEANLREMEESA